MARPPTPTPDDRALVDRCIARDQEGWEELLERFSRLIYSVIHGTLRRHGQATDEDGVEELFGAAFLALTERDGRRLRQWSGRCSLASWLRLVTASVVVDALRRRRPTVPWPDDEVDPLTGRALGEAAEAPWAALRRADRVRAVQGALAQLRDTDRDLLVRLFHHEESAEAVAAELGIRPGALYTRKNRALGRLKAALVEALGSDVLAAL